MDGKNQARVRMIVDNSINYCYCNQGSFDSLQIFLAILISLKLIYGLNESRRQSCAKIAEYFYHLSLINVDLFSSCYQLTVYRTSVTVVNDKLSWSRNLPLVNHIELKLRQTIKPAF